MNGKIINPESGRPVNILGKLGQRILGNLYKQHGGKSTSTKKNKNKPKKKRKVRVKIQKVFLKRNL